jgi:hypothetical protein
MARIGRIELPTEDRQSTVLPLNYIPMGWMVGIAPNTFAFTERRAQTSTLQTPRLKTSGAPTRICAEFSRLQGECIANNALRAWYIRQESNPHGFVRSEVPQSVRPRMHGCECWSRTNLTRLMRPVPKPLG